MSIWKKCIYKCSCIISVQVMYKPFEAIPFIPFVTIPFKFHILICIYVHGKKIGGHVNDLGSKSCCHQSRKILTCPQDKVRIIHRITTKLCRYLPLVMVMNWLILLEIFFCQICFSKFWFYFFMVKHSIGHIWGMVGMIDLKWIADALKLVLDQL